MAKTTLFDYVEYREYLENKLKSSVFGRGAKAKLAQHLNCQPSYISQVIKNKSSFSLEQAFKINSFLQHNPLEKEFFLNLVEMDRAGSFELKQYFDNKRKELLEKSKLVENQMSYDQLSDVDAIAYYNDWNHILIRNLVDIAEFKTVNALKKKLSLNEDEFDKAFEFLIQKGLIKESEDGLIHQGLTRLHIKKESPLAKYGNITTRLQMIKNLDKVRYNSINYSSNMTIPKASFEEFRKRFSQLIVELNTDLSKDTPGEMMASLIVDFVEI